MKPTHAIELLQAFIRTPSVNPDGNPGISHPGEKAFAELVATFLESLGAQVELQEILPDRPNVIGRFPTNTPGKPVILLCPHLDTVSVAGMTIDPFSGERREGKIWGRGASDTKGSMAAMLWALHELQEDIPTLPVEIHFTGFMAEETGQLGAIAFAKRHHERVLAGEESLYTFAIAGEPTELKTVHATKGCLWVDLTTRGEAAHASLALPEAYLPEGQPCRRNAIADMARVLTSLNQVFYPSITTPEWIDPILGAVSMNCGTIQGGSKANIIASECHVRLDFRTTPTLENDLPLLDRLRQFCSQLDEAPEISVFQTAKPLLTPQNHPMVQHLAACGRGLTTAPWFCDAAKLAEVGIPSVAAGPGSIAQAHTQDEWILESDFLEGVEFFKKFLRTVQG